MRSVIPCRRFCLRGELLKSSNTSNYLEIFQQIGLSELSSLTSFVKSTSVGLLDIIPTKLLKGGKL